MKDSAWGMVWGLLFAVLIFGGAMLVIWHYESTPERAAMWKAYHANQHRKQAKWEELNKMPEDDPRWAEVYDREFGK